MLLGQRVLILSKKITGHSEILPHPFTNDDDIDHYTNRLEQCQEWEKIFSDKKRELCNGAHLCYNSSEIKGEIEANPMAKAVKTNAMRKLETAKIPYEIMTYTVEDDNFDGLLVAQKVGMNPDTVFKTLVLKGEKTGYLVCCIPVNRELDLKAAAQAAGDKKVEMLPMKDLLATTGYVRGGCSPVGMKKAFPTYFDESVLNCEKIAVSAGQRGIQMILEPRALIKLVGGKCANLTRG